MRLPMFPLGTVLFPGMVLPLHVFEERYRALMRACLAATGPLGRAFGVALIARGSEVGGGDTRFDTACVGHIVSHEEAPDGRYFVGVRGGERVRVDRWLPDDPFPIAEVAVLPAPPASDDLAAALEGCALTIRKSLAYQAELGILAPPPTVELASDLVDAIWQLCALAPCGPLDRQHLLELADHRERLDLLARLASDAVDVFAWRLSGG